MLCFITGRGHVKDVVSDHNNNDIVHRLFMSEGLFLREHTCHDQQYLPQQPYSVG